MNFILASKSPRRIKLMQDMNIKFKAIESKINENDINIQKPHSFCKKLAIKKSNAGTTLLKFDLFRLISLNL